MTREDFIADLDAAAVDQDARTATLIARSIAEIEGLEDLFLRALAVLEVSDMIPEFIESLNREQHENYEDFSGGMTLGSSADE